MADRLERLFAVRDIANHVVASDPFSASITRMTCSPAHRTPKKVSLPSSQKWSPTQRSVNDKSVTTHLDRLEGILSGFTSFAASCPTHFFLSKTNDLFPGAILTQDKRTVTRYRQTDTPLVHLSKPLETGTKLIIRIDGLPDSRYRVHSSAFVFLVKYSFDGDPVCEKEVPITATTGTSVSFELTTGKKLIVITVFKNTISATHYLYLDNDSATKMLYPAIRMTGNASVLTIISRDSHLLPATGGSARDPIRKRPNASSSNSLQVTSQSRSSSSASSAYSSLATTPSPPKQQSPDPESGLRKDVARKMGDVESVEEPGTQEQKVAPAAGPKSVPKLENAVFPKEQLSGSQPVLAVIPEQKQDVEPAAKKMRNKKRKWFNNLFMRWEKSVITRIRSPSHKNYIFSNEFRVNQVLVIKVLEVDSSGTDSETGASVRLGYTSTPLLELDTSCLPVDPRDVLLFNQSDSEYKWRLSPNLFTSVGAFDGLKFTRNQNGIQMSIESGESVLVMDVASSETVFPFIHMSGSVKSISVLTP